MRISNDPAVLAKYDHVNRYALKCFIERLLQDCKDDFQTIHTEGCLVAWTTLQVVLNVADTASRSMVTMIIMHCSSWLDSEGISSKLQTEVCFNGYLLFHNKTDKAMKSLKDSRAKLRSLGIYTLATLQAPALLVVTTSFSLQAV